jgi:hypothetical protein
MVGSSRRLDPGIDARQIGELEMRTEQQLQVRSG